MCPPSALPRYASAYTGPIDTGLPDSVFGFGLPVVFRGYSCNRLTLPLAYVLYGGRVSIMR
jgi:hypothetical protein